MIKSKMNVYLVIQVIIYLMMIPKRKNVLNVQWIIVINVLEVKPIIFASNALHT
jgi:hypothetical protein